MFSSAESLWQLWWCLCSSSALAPPLHNAHCTLAPLQGSGASVQYAMQCTVHCAVQCAVCSVQCGAVQWRVVEGNNASPARVPAQPSPAQGDPLAPSCSLPTSFLLPLCSLLPPVRFLLPSPTSLLPASSLLPDPSLTLAPSSSLLLPYPCSLPAPCALLPPYSYAIISQLSLQY